MRRTTGALEDFLGARDRIRQKREGNGGLETCSVLTATLDRAIRGLLPDDWEEPVAVVALGSFGRGELCLWSDIDLMVLHDGADPDRLAKTVFYPLWDVNLKVGHSIRTVKECVSAARERIDSMTSLLSARLIHGTPHLYHALQEGVTGVTAGRPLSPLLASLELDRRAAQPYPVMAADVKQGRGGLRTFQSLDWERKRARLLGQTPSEETETERRARSVLLAVRNGLHAATGRGFDVFDIDLREQVARWLDDDLAAVSRELCRALRTGDRLAELHWPGLTTSGDPVAALGRGIARRLRRSRTGPLHTAGRIAADPGLSLSDARVRSELTGTAEQVWTDQEREGLIRLLRSGERGMVVFGWLDELGWVGRHFPEWASVSALPQLAPFHEHPVDAHLWRTVEEIRGVLVDPDPLTAAVISDLGSEDVLLLAAFLHDIGKGRDGDHSILGSEAARSFLTRAGFSSSTVELVAKAVRHHLLLARSALRRDIASPEVIEEVAGSVGDLPTLQTVYLLTIADSRATGRTTWSKWKATLVRQLYVRAAALFGTGDRLTVVDAVSAARLSQGRFRLDEVEAHLEGLPPDYAWAMEPSDVLSHMKLISRFSGPTLVEAGEPNRVLVVGRDRTGFLLTVCRAFTAHGIAVDEARLYTRSDGIALDVFVVRPSHGEGQVSPETWARIENALASGQDLTGAVTERAVAYDRVGSAQVSVRARPELSDRDIVFEVRSPDRVGLLVDIVEGLFEEGLDLRQARIDTRAGHAVDVLHVEGGGLTGGELEEICSRLAARIGESGDPSAPT